MKIINKIIIKQNKTKINIKIKNTVLTVLMIKIIHREMIIIIIREMIIIIREMIIIIREMMIIVREMIIIIREMIIINREMIEIINNIKIIIKDLTRNIMIKRI